MHRRIPVLPFLFGLLAAGKAFLVLQENQFTEYKSALVYMAIFGSPQIYWLLLTIRATTNKQATIAAVALLIFTLSAWYFGFIPGTPSPAWGGEGHFEVPIALLAEWLVAGLLFVPFWLFRSRVSSNVA